MFIAELVDPDEKFHLLNSASGFPNDPRSYVAPVGAIKFHDSSRARLKRLEIVYKRVVALFEPVNEVVILADGGSSRVWFAKYITQLRASGPSHQRFRNLRQKAASTRTIATFTISRSQNQFLKNRTSTPITTATGASS